MTIAGPLFELNMTLCLIDGTLALGANSTTFTFKYPSNILVRAGGSLQDLTSQNTINLPAYSLITLHPSGTVVGSGTKVQTGATSARLFQTPTNTTTLARLGPFTCGVLPERQLSDTKVTFIAVRSGSFTSGSVYLGGFAPNKTLCALVGGCGINIIRNVVLTTTDLGGQLDMKIDELGVEESAVLDLGTPGQPNGFTFLYPIELDIYGTLSYLAGAGPINILPNSAVNRFPNGIFNSSEPSAFFKIYNSSNPSASNSNIPFTSLQSGPGPIYFNVGPDGALTNNTNGK